MCVFWALFSVWSSSDCRAFWSVCVCRPLFRVCRPLLRVRRALWGMCRALRSVRRDLWNICRALCSVCWAFWGVCRLFFDDLKSVIGLIEEVLESIADVAGM